MMLGMTAIVVLIFSVWLVGAKAASNVRASEARARIEQAHRDDVVRQKQTSALRAGCARGVARDFESWQTNHDLRRLALDAAAARRAEGNLKVARRYASTASHAGFRMDKIRLRLPKHEDDATIADFCRSLYPDPATQ
jgi:hypothetical protein